MGVRIFFMFLAFGLIALLAAVVNMVQVHNGITVMEHILMLDKQEVSARHLRDVSVTPIPATPSAAQSVKGVSIYRGIVTPTITIMKK